MKMEKIALSENHWIHETARICGEVTVGCSEAAGVLERFFPEGAGVADDYWKIAARWANNLATK